MGNERITLINNPYCKHTVGIYYISNFLFFVRMDPNMLSKFSTTELCSLLFSKIILS